MLPFDLRGRLLKWSAWRGVWFEGGAGAFLRGRGLVWVKLFAVPPFTASPLRVREGEGVVFL